ncbi:MAG: alpha/beta hydrolase [Desulfobacterium sp.]|nr:alpha/beta hydrolase [Desulfobacterium sp.]
MDILFETIKFVVILAVALVAFVYFFQSRLIFFPQKTPVGMEQSLKAHEVKVTNQGQDLYGWFVDAPGSKASPLIVYYGGNAEEVSGSLEEARRNMVASLLFMNYRGYGKSQGRPSEQRLLSDALAIFDWIIAGQGIDPSRVILMGRSLGTGIAVHVAAHRQVGALILVTPFDSLVNVAKGIYPFLPVGKLLRHRFDSVSAAPGIKTPMLAVIADQDEIIPTANSLNLVNAWGGPAETLAIKGATHNDISAFPSYWKEIERFINDKKH